MALGPQYWLKYWPWEYIGIAGPWSKNVNELESLWWYFPWTDYNLVLMISHKEDALIDWLCFLFAIWLICTNISHMHWSYFTILVLPILAFFQPQLQNRHEKSSKPSADTFMTTLCNMSKISLISQLIREQISAECIQFPQSIKISAESVCVSASFLKYVQIAFHVDHKSKILSW